METSEPDEIDSVNGLMDSQRVAAYLGVPRGTIRSWASRKAAGTPGVHEQFPDPRPEQLGGTALWDVEAIRSFKKTFDETKQGRKKEEPKDAANVLHAVGSKHD